MADRKAREVILEFHQIGKSVKVTAVDIETLVEVSMVGDSAASETELGRLAVRKLEYVLRKQREKSNKR